MSTLLIILLTFGLIGWFVIREPTPRTGTSGNSFGDWLSNWLGMGRN